MKNDEKWMNLAIKQAQKADYQTWQNPRVGAVIVKNQKLLSGGYTQRFGQAHAERDAISKLTAEQLANATLYVTLEPCNHYGKQPPCTHLIVKSGIKRVVIAETDPHSLVTGKGIRYLRDHEIEVTTGVLTEQAIEVNPHYNYYFRTHHPWVTVKQAISLDGKVAAGEGERTTITNHRVYDFVHQERAWYHGILIGSETAIVDNPRLIVNVETVFPPIRIIVDRRGRLAEHPNLQLLHDPHARTWVFSENQTLVDSLSKTRAEVIFLADCSIGKVIKECGRCGLQSLYIEGGPTIQRAVVDSNLVNEIITYLSPQFIGQQGVAGVQIPSTVVVVTSNIKLLGNNVRIDSQVKQNV